MNISTALKGMAMGIAEVIPGVSGGTIAFITGIYERLLLVIKSFNLSLLKTYKAEGFNGVWKQIDGTFLVFLLGGMLGGIIIGVLGVSRLMESHPEVLWAFFFGLIIASAVYIARQIKSWHITEIVMLLLGISIAYFITTISPSTGNQAYWFVFISGAIAISALILPGVSGSYILLIMGMYKFIISDTLKGFVEALGEGNIATDKLLTLGIFSLGCLFGLVSISRILSWAFKRYHDVVLALLTGFILGSLNKIWPWRHVTEALNTDTGELVYSYNRNAEDLKILKEVNVSPFDYMDLTGYDNHFYLAIGAAVAGFLLVFLLEKFGNKTP